MPVPTGRAVAQEGVQGAEVILARASRRKEKSSALPPGMQQAVPLAVFGDWNVFTNGAQAREKLCYVIAQPTARSPKTLARDTGYLFVTFPKGGGQGEIRVSIARSIEMTCTLASGFTVRAPIRKALVEAKHEGTGKEAT